MVDVTGSKNSSNKQLEAATVPLKTDNLLADRSQSMDSPWLVNVTHIDMIDSVDSNSTHNYINKT
jgi:hypothetical protein